MKPRIYSTIILLLLLLAADTTVLLNVDFLFLRQIITFAALLVIPGTLLKSILRINKEAEGENIVYVFGLSLALNIFCGLIINAVLPLFNISTPLTTYPVLISFNLLCGFLMIMNIIWGRNEANNIGFKNLSFYKHLLFLVHLLIPLLSSLGAIILNNQGSNILSLFLIAFCGVYILIIAWFYKSVQSYLYPIIIYSISLAMLLMLSLRSWYIAGFDISMEYEVFRITQENGLWLMKNFVNVYNACVSITILPTYFQVLLHVPPEYVFKLFYQVIFAITPVGIYFLLKKINIPTHIAFFAGIFYICTPWFIDPMVTLARQEVAFFFFILILFVLFDKSIHSIQRHILFIIFCTAMVLSHYSTTYMTIMLFNGGYVMFSIIRIFRRLRKKSVVDYEFKLNIFYLIYLFVAAVSWYSIINHSTNNIEDFSRNTLSNLYNVFNFNARSGIIDQLFKSSQVNVTSKTYAEYYKVKSGEYSIKNDVYKYSPETYSGYNIIPATYQTIPIANRTLYEFVNLYFRISLLLIEGLLLLGTIKIFFFDKTDNFNYQYKVLILACEILLAAMIVLPYVSFGYNFDRLYMQTMYILGIVEILGAFFLFGFAFGGGRRTVIYLSLFYVGTFFFTYGLTWQLVGGKAVMWLNNYGYSYDETYTHKEEVYSAAWIGEIPGNPLIYTTPTGRNILAAYAAKNNINSDIFPSTIDRNSYVYTTVVNTKERIASFFYRGIHLGYIYPYEFLNNSKDKVYSNGGSEIFK